jgi:hypothetical protein
MRRGTTLGAVTLVLLAACGDDAAMRDSDTERGEEYVDAAVSAIIDESGDDGTAGQRDGLRCMMARSVDAIGLDALDNAAVTPEEFAAAENLPAVGLEVSEDQARDAAGAFFECFDMVEIFVLDEATEDERECARNALDAHKSELREAAKEELLGRGETDLPTAVDELLLAECEISIYID